VQIVYYLVIRESDNLATLSFQIPFPLEVSLCSRVVAVPVKLDHKAARWAKEVDDIRPDYMLAAEPNALQLAAAQFAP
jgi:hypothetical protein